MYRVLLQFYFKNQALTKKSCTLPNSVYPKRFVTFILVLSQNMRPLYTQTIV